MPAETGSPPAALSMPQRTVLACLTIYKVLLSPLFPGACRFLPSCSQYAREAVIAHGTVKGTWLAARRLSRCQPFGSSGLDPVPGTTQGVRFPRVN